MEFQLAKQVWINFRRWGFLIFWRSCSFFAVYYFPDWDLPIYGFHWNGGREVGECFDGTINIGRIAINLTLFNLNRPTSKFIKFWAGAEHDPDKNGSVMHH